MSSGDDVMSGEVTPCCGDVTSEGVSSSSKSSSRGGGDLKYLP